MSYMYKRVGRRGEVAVKDMFGCMKAAKQELFLKISVPLGNGG